MDVIFFVFILVSVILALRKPTTFVVSYLVATTKFMGFYDMEVSFVFDGTSLGFPALNAVALLGIARAGTLSSMPRIYLKFIIGLVFALLYGIGFPVLLGLENFLQAIIAGKDFLTITFFIYLATNRKSLDISKVLKSVKVIGAYISLAYVAYHLFGIAPPHYIQEDGFRAFFPTYISMSLFIYYADWKGGSVNSIKFVIIAFLSFSGLVLAGHAALTIGTLACLLFVFFAYRNGRFSFGKLIVRATLAVLISITVVMIAPEFRRSILDSVDLIMSGKDPALSSRNIYNEFRWNAIQERFLTGYGFVHKSTPITNRFRMFDENRFSESFGVIDSGYVDLLIKFGSLGTVLYLMLWAWVVRIGLKKSRSISYIQIVMSFYLLQYFPVCFTWSVFTFVHGLVPGFVAAFAILSGFSATQKV